MDADLNNQGQEDFDALVKQAEAELQSPKPDVAYQRLNGCVAGCSLGFILSFVLYILLAVLDHNYAKPGDRDFLNPLGAIVYTLIIMVIGAIIGAIRQPFIERAKKNRR